MVEPTEYVVTPSPFVICRSAERMGGLENVEVGIGAGVRVGFGPPAADVEEGEVGRMNNCVRVGLGVATNVLVDDGTFVAGCVGGNVPVPGGKGVPVVNCAPGVRKTLSQAGLVRMDESTGSKNPLGRRVRKSRFGSRFDSMLVSSSQLEEKRSAHPPASRMHKSPNRRMRTMMIQSRLSCSRACIIISI